jgi:hypothetical protein
VLVDRGRGVPGVRITRMRSRGPNFNLCHQARVVGHGLVVVDEVATKQPRVGLRVQRGDHTQSKLIRTEYFCLRSMRVRANC